MLFGIDVLGILLVLLPKNFPSKTIFKKLYRLGVQIMLIFLKHMILYILPLHLLRLASAYLFF